MLFPLASAYTLGSLAFGSSFAQYFPPEPTAITKFQSLVHPGAKISYKKVSLNLIMFSCRSPSSH